MRDDLLVLSSLRGNKNLNPGEKGIPPQVTRLLSRSRIRAAADLTMVAPACIMVPVRRREIISSGLRRADYTSATRLTRRRTPAI